MKWERLLDIQTMIRIYVSISKIYDRKLICDDNLTGKHIKRYIDSRRLVIITNKNENVQPKVTFERIRLL